MTAEPPVVRDGLDAEAYHRDPALSASGAKLLIPPSGTPAHYREAMDNPRPPTAAMRLGTALHTRVLGVGQPWRVVEGDRRTKGVREQLAECEAEGVVPVSEAEGAYLDGAVDAVLRHPLARALFEQPGRPEVSIWATDPETGVRMRCRPDYLPEPNGAGELVVPDLKSARTAAPGRFDRSSSDLLYHLQAAWYEDVIARATERHATVVLVAVEKTPPYLVAVHQPDAEAMRVGDGWRRYALRTFAECTKTGHWPGYPEQAVPLSLPAWAPRPEEYEDA